MLNKLFPIFIVLLLGACATSQKGVQKGPLSLEDSIKDMMTLIEKKEYEKLISTYAKPDDLEAMTSDISLQELAREFGGEPAEELYEALTDASGKKPEYNEDKTLAIFDVDNFDKDLIFQKIGDRWYLAD